MKKILTLVLTLIIIAVCNIPVLANESVSVVYNGNELYFDTPACIVGERAFVPVRDVLVNIGASVIWDDANKMIYASRGDISVWLQVDNVSATYIKNGAVYVYKLDVAPCIINNKMFVPVRVIGDVFGLSVLWDGFDRIVRIDSEVSTVKPVTNVSASATPAPGKITISGFTAPSTINVGQAFVLSGEVSSNNPLNRLNIKVKDKTDGTVEINETQFDISKSVYFLTEIDSRVKFGTLSRGQKTMEITAVDSYEYRQTFSYDFEVKQPGGVSLGSDMKMLWPVPSSGMITTIFWCDNPSCHSNAGRVNGHAAIDIGAPQDAEVISVQDGIVRNCGFGNYLNGHSGYGNFIEVDHGNGIITQYAHLHSIYVTQGERVSAGQVIGGVGNTGNSTGNHLDFHIERDGKRCDPLYYIDIPSNAYCTESCDVKYFDEALKSRGLK